MKLTYALCLAATLGWSAAASAASADYVARKNYGAKLEVANKVLVGAGQDAQGYKDYVSAVGTAPKFYMDYTGLSSLEIFYLRLKSGSIPAGTTLQLGLHMTKTVSGKAYGIDKDVAAGKYDSQIKSLASTLKSMNRPVFLRIGYEFEGSWNNYTPATYKQAFIRITNIMRQSGVNVATVWCSAGGSGGKVGKTEILDTYYPGDQYVDWFGVDLFDRGEFNSANLAIFLKNAEAHKKPVMIGETTPRGVGVLKGQESWDSWFEPYFGAIKRNANIKAISYINWNWATHTDYGNWSKWGDARLHMNSVVKAKYAAEVKNAPFQNK